MNLAKRLHSGHTIRAIGFDDARYRDKTPGEPVHVAGVVCRGTRFEGMVWGCTTKDGATATDEIIRLLRDSKFAEQVHIVLLDGLTMGGCNVVDLPRLAAEVAAPAVAVMRHRPNLERFKYVVDRLPDPEERWRRVLAAGPIHEIGQSVFQVSGEEPETVARVLKRLTIEGKVPEALRLAHLIGAAITTGESGKRA